MTNQNENKAPQRWEVSVDAEGVLTFPDGLLDQLGWKEGDEIKFIDQEDGSFLMEKVDEVAA